MNPQSLRLFLRLARPHFLLGAALLYALGVGIAHYLGIPIDWGVYFLGQAWVSLLQLSTHFLNEFYDGPSDQDNPNRTLFSGGSGTIGPGKLSRSTALIAAGACLAMLASLTVLLINQGILTPASSLIMLLAFIGSFFYSAPPIKLSASGYGELTTSILVANLVPAFAFLLQAGELHRLVAMTTFPLTVLHLAMMLAFELPDYATDIKYQKRTLMVRLNWQNGMLLHNLLVLVAFFLLGLAVAYGLPSRIALPAFFALPIGLLQIWQMRRLADGAKPNWTALTITSVALFGMTAYMLTFAFWTR
jgi:1,4-dihydroxy-2-naphthoate octaprenyltransferase